MVQLWICIIRVWFWMTIQFSCSLRHWPSLRSCERSVGNNIWRLFASSSWRVPIYTGRSKPITRKPKRLLLLQQLMWFLCFTWTVMFQPQRWHGHGRVWMHEWKLRGCRGSRWFCASRRVLWLRYLWRWQNVLGIQWPLRKCWRNLQWTWWWLIEVPVLRATTQRN